MMRNDLKRLDTWDGPDQWSQIESRLPRDVQPEPPHRPRLTAGLVGAAVAVAGLGFVFLQFRGPEERAKPGGPGSVQHLVATERTIDTRLRFPEGAVTGFGSVWVATRHADREGGDILRLDPSTGDEVARIAMPSLPGWTFGGAGITAGSGSVWVAAGGTGNHTPTTLYRIDPSSNTLAEALDVGPGRAADVWVDGTGVWVLSFSDGTEPMFLYRLDPSAHDVTDTTDIPASWSQNVFAAGGWVYVWASTGGTVPAETLFRIDPDTAEIVERSQPGDGNEFSVVPSGDRIWFFNDGLRALDAGSGAEVVGPLSQYANVFCCSLLVADGFGGVWVMSERPTDQRKECLVHLDADGRVIATTGPVLGPDAQGIAATYDAATSSFWIVHYEDTVLRIGLTERTAHDLERAIVDVELEQLLPLT